MEYKIVEKESFIVIGNSIEVPTKGGHKTAMAIPKFWHQCNADGTRQTLNEVGELHPFLGITMPTKKGADSFTYIIGVENVKNVNHPDYQLFEVPASTWAVFTTVGSVANSIQKGWNFAWKEWLPSSDYVYDGGPTIEALPEGNNNAKDYVCEVWLPVTKK